MSALTLKFTAKTNDRYDLSPLVPSKLAGLGPTDIEALSVGITKEKVTVGDIFKVKGNDPARLRLIGTNERCDFIGKELTAGNIVVDGDAGAYLGSFMRGGEIAVSGSTGAYSGGSMRGGAIDIAGDAGEKAGAAMVGEVFGMRGGRIVVAGNAGALLGERMRRGLIIVYGNAGDYVGGRMVAGTILIKGKVGRYAGMSLRRGTLVLAKEPQELLPTFGDSGVLDFEYLRLLDRALRAGGAKFKLGARARRLMGDMAVLGKGEMLILV